MPLANIYVSDSRLVEQLGSLSNSLSEEIAKQLSVMERQLTSDEVSVRIVEPKPGSKPIAAVEMEIVAHLYKERVGKADQVCNDLRKFMLSRLKGISDLRVWLVLSEKGHSWPD